MRLLTRIVLASAFMFFICYPSIGLAGEPKRMITITDAFKNKANILIPAERIVVINSDAAEILCALGVEEKIVGVSDHIAGVCSNLHSELKGKPMVGSPQSPSIEKIIELRPDIVIYYDMWLKEEALELKLAPLGIPVARIPCYRVDSIERDVRILGKIVGKEKESEEYVKFFQKYLNEVTKRLKCLKRKIRVYAEGYGNYCSVSEGSGADGILRTAGVDNIATGQPVPFPKISPEWVVEKNPEVIIKAASSGWVKTGYGISDVDAVAAFRDVLMNRPVWNQIEAVKKGKVYLVSYEIWSGPRAPIGILYIAKWCYPERFEDIDPQMIHRQWLMKWHKKKLKGIYVYP